MKISKKDTLALIAILFTLDVDLYVNDPEFYFWFHEWDKYGVDSIKHIDNLSGDVKNEFNAPFVEKMVKQIQEDFASGYWKQDKDGFYNYMMPTEYGGWINKAFEHQIANASGIGVQAELNFA